MIIAQEITDIKIGIAGTGGTPGSATISGTTGTGRVFSATGTINTAGQLTALTLLDSGEYVTGPTNPQAEPVTGGSVTGATVVLTLAPARNIGALPGPYTVATLPAAAVGYKGQRTFVTDANATFTAGIGAAVAAGGANVVPVFCDGAAWRIG